MTTPPTLVERLSLQGKHALVCGASAGIGRETARTLAGQKATLTILARSQAKLDALATELRALGAPDVHVLVANMEDLEALRDQVGAHVGQHAPLHILVHNTGGPPGGSLLAAGVAALQTAFQRHVLSAQVLVQTLLPGMQQAGYGRIVNVLSTSVREPIANLGVSNTIRAAMAGWAKTLSSELPVGTTINNVLPGFTATDRLTVLATSTAERTGISQDAVFDNWRAAIPEGRLGEAHEIAALIGFLVSPAASYIRGQSIAADGGRMRSI
jgi:3-oxoacyl-[acyl-carrier protein] reductase